MAILRHPICSRIPRPWRGDDPAHDETRYHTLGSLFTSGIDHYNADDLHLVLFPLRIHGINFIAVEQVIRPADSGCNFDLGAEASR